MQRYLLQGADFRGSPRLIFPRNLKQRLPDAEPKTFASSAGSSACEACEPGTYQIKTGSSQCIRCPAGYLQSDAASTECSVCEAGKFSSAQGSAEDANAHKTSRTCRRLAASTSVAHPPEQPILLWAWDTAACRRCWPPSDG